MLCFLRQTAEMPIKSGKNLFAFLQKSDYNDRQTII